MKKEFLILAVFLLVAGGAAYYLNTTKSPTKPATNTPQSKLREMGDPTLGFSLKLPDNFTVEKNGEFSRMFRKKTSPSAGPTNFIYVSVIPQGKEVEDGEIYNYNTSDYEALEKLMVDDSVTFGTAENKDISKYYIYTRLDDKIIGGYGAKTYKNELPWEFPKNTTEYRYIIPFTQAKFVIGAYTSEENNPDYGITKVELDNLFKNLKLTPETIKFVFTSPKPQGDWDEFSSDSPFIKLDYPTNWNLLTESQNFPEGDLFAINVIGQTQKPQTELYDGAMFAVMKPTPLNEDINTWIEKRYTATINPELPENKPEFSKASFSGKTYEKIVVCGLGCFTYYHIVQNNMLYGFVANFVGPHSATYEQVISKIMSSINYDK